jgi:hypothetical protein
MTFGRDILALDDREFGILFQVGMETQLFSSVQTNCEGHSAS